MKKTLEIKIVSSDTEYAQAMEVRRLVFVEEEKIPAAKEFDGNDHCATHILACCDGRPIGTMRIRYFNGFVKFERMGVLPEFRKSVVAARIMHFGMDFCARKGYEKVYGICKKELLNRWQKEGFSAVPGAPEIQQNGMSLLAISCPLPKVENALSMQTAGEVLNAPEGRWDEVSPAEQTADLLKLKQNSQGYGG